MAGIVASPLTLALYTIGVAGLVALLAYRPH